MNKVIERLKREFQDEDYRYAYDEEFSNSRMATQSRAIREQRGFTQKELAEIAEMKQSRISELENVNYNAWSISTLRRIAKALGVRLFFGFEGWGEILPEINEFNRISLQKPKFEDDIAFKNEEKGTQNKSRRKSKTTKRSNDSNQRNLHSIQLIKNDNNALSQSNVANEKLNNYMTDGKPKAVSPLDKMALGSTSNIQKEAA